MPLSGPPSDPLDCLPPDGRLFTECLEVDGKLQGLDDSQLDQLSEPSAQLRAPLTVPRKIFLLAGNYAAHIEEGGSKAAERAETFPYVFMKPWTTVNHPGGVVRIPAVSPNYIDYECELAVVIGRTCKAVSESDALQHVAGYTIVNDISDRKFRPNPKRTDRDKDSFFDWLHGKWHDTFCPMGPAILAAGPGVDPQQFDLELRVNGHLKQQASTGQMIFPVAAVIEFLSSIATLEPGDVISTGTPSGVGAASQEYLRAGDRLEAKIDPIGVLVNQVG